MLRIRRAKRTMKRTLTEERFQEAKVRIVMRVRGVTREKALVLLSAGDSSSVEKGRPAVNPAAMSGHEDDRPILMEAPFDL